MQTNCFSRRLVSAAVLCGMVGSAPVSAAPNDSNDASITIYNQQFAVVRQTLPLHLNAGRNHVAYQGITNDIEPTSVILRDPTGKTKLRVAEQNYRADPVTQRLLLSLFTGKTISFEVTQGGETQIVQGRIIRSGYTPPPPDFTLYGEAPSYDMVDKPSLEPLIEVDGKIQSGLPGKPLFPALPDDSILKPTLDWTLQADHAGNVNAELAYVTGNMRWEAAYNAVEPANGHTLDLTGWVTIVNNTGKTFTNAKIKLMAGDVSKLQKKRSANFAFTMGGARDSLDYFKQRVTEKTFDEYHLYSLSLPTTLRDQGSKQIQMLHGAGVQVKDEYVYDGATLDSNQSDYNILHQQNYGTAFTTKVATYQTFVNSQANHLGMPLPKGLIRFYRRDTDGQLEYIGENTIDHTPKNETIRVLTGNAFDLTAERTQKSYVIDYQKNTLDESFSITVNSHKSVPAQVHIIEHLYRAANCTISGNTSPFVKKDARTIEFVVTVPAGGSKVVGYTAGYS